MLLNVNPLGAAGVAAALIYAGLTFLTTPKITLLVQLFMPILMLLAYLLILGKPGKVLPSTTPTKYSDDAADQSQGSVNDDRSDTPARFDDSKPLLSEAKDEEEDGMAAIQVHSKWINLKLRFFNKEELGKSAMRECDVNLVLLFDFFH